MSATTPNNTDTYAAQPHAALVRAAQQGERAAFDELVRRFFGMTYAIGLAHLEDAVLAQDLAQEAFLRTFLCLGRLQNPDAFPGWISRTARNLAIDWQRRGNLGSRITGMIPLDPTHDQIPDTTTVGARDKMQTDETRNAVREALHKLPPDQREIVLLHYMEGMSQDDIAQRLGMHRSTVSRALKLALSRLRGLVIPMLQDAMPAFQAPQTATARALVLVTTTAALSTTQKSALAAKCISATAGTVASSATATAPLTISTGLHSAAALIKSGGVIMGSTKGIIVSAAAVLAIGGGAYYIKEAKASAAAATAAKSFSVPVGPSIIPPVQPWKPYRDWNHLAAEYVVQHPENVGFAKLAQALPRLDLKAIAVHRPALDEVLAKGWTAATPALQAALATQQPAADLAFAAAVHAPFEMPPTFEATVPVPPYAAVQQLNKVMLASALAYEASGHLDAATQRALATARLSQSFGTTGSILLSHMIGTGGLANSAKVLAMLLRNPKVTPEMAAAVLDSLNALEAQRPSYSEVIRAEGSFTIATARLYLKNPAATKTMDESVKLMLGKIKSLPEYEKNTDQLFRRLAGGFEAHYRARPRLDAAVLKALSVDYAKASWPLPNLDEAATRSEIAWARVRLCKQLAELRAGGANANATALDPFTGTPVKVIVEKVYSFGPDATDQNGAIIYDATNGTVSAGDIVALR